MCVSFYSGQQYITYSDRPPHPVCTYTILVPRGQFLSYSFKDICSFGGGMEVVGCVSLSMCILQSQCSSPSVLLCVEYSLKDSCGGVFWEVR